MENFILTGNGSTQINKKHKDARSAVYTSGTFGVEATAAITYKNKSGVHIPFVDGALIIGEQIPVSHGNGVDIYVTIENSDPGTSVEITCAGID